MHMFPPQSKENWLKKVDKVTKGQAFDADAVLYQRQSGPGAARTTQGPWRIFMRMDHGDVSRAEHQAAEDVANGAGGLIVARAELIPVLATLPLHQLALRNEAGDESAEAIVAQIAAMPLDPARLAIDFGVASPDLARRLNGKGFSGPLMRSDGRKFHDQGCDDGQELGAVMATAMAAFSDLDFLAAATRAHAVSITLAASQDFLTTIAKFRAARVLWRDILSRGKLPDASLALHGETSSKMFAGVDVHSNILRAVSAAFGAGLGGADSFSVLPFSIKQGVPNAFARRVARNVQNILLHESHLWRVADPAAGAGAFEKKTEQLCNEALKVIQSVERGVWPSGVSTVRPVIGVTSHRPAHELPPEVV